MKYTIYIDGGCLNNQTATMRKAYGSCRIEKEDGSLRHFFTKNYGNKTNNQAEYLILIDALKWLSKNTDVSKDTSIINTDSQLIVSQLEGGYRVHSMLISVLFKKATALLHPSMAIIKVPRDTIKSKLGH